MRLFLSGAVRVLGPVVAGLLLAGGSAAPAVAGPPTFTLSLHEVRSFAPGEQTQVDATFDVGDVPGQFRLEDVVLTVDISDLDGIATITHDGFGDECDVDGDTVTCWTEGRDLVLHDGTWQITLFSLRGGQPGAAGTTAQLPVTATSSNAGAASDTATLTKADAVDLAVVGSRDFEKKAPLGSRITVPLGVKNIGDTAVEGLVLWWEGGEGAYFKDTFSNCTYVSHFVVCRFDVTIAPGASYKLSRPFPLDISADQAAPGYARAHYHWSTIDKFDTDIQPGRPDDRKPGSLPAVQLVHPSTGKPAPSSPTSGDVPQHDLSENGNDFGTVYVTVTGNNPRDLAAVGATVTGTQADLTVGLRNVGKVPLEDPDSDSPWRIAKITLPEGVTATSVPEPCQAITGGYLCEARSPFRPGTEQLWTFPVTIAEGTKDGVGSVTLVGDGAADDQNPKNDTAKILVNPSSSPSPSTSPSGPPASPAPGGPGAMPRTGSSLTWPIAGGVLAVLVGALLYAVARRRPDAATGTADSGE